MAEIKTMHELVEEELASPGSTLADGVFDYALPQGWVADVKDRTGQWPEGFVWHYPPRSIFGHAFPLTEAATILLAEYEEAVRA